LTLFNVISEAKINGAPGDSVVVFDTLVEVSAGNGTQALKSKKATSTYVICIKASTKNFKE
jgi:hypothetical protein